MYKREEAVSPVIGVILMVAITVILAAVIAAFVFGMAGNVDKTKMVSVVAERNTSGIVFTNYGGQDVGKLNQTAGDTFTIKINGAEITPVGDLGPKVGDMGFAEGGGADFTSLGNGKDDVTVLGNFQDGKSAIVYNSKL
ncbi:MAG: type IV pilin [Methanomicrobiales archaeon HGW-Methanomicrobiales-4]|nr:MAG: type IV pilin [Methanomicrobiales archaeon HGW-Methanomicrobiales-4]